MTDIENRIKVLEKQVKCLTKENVAISKILIDKVKPVVDDWEAHKMEVDYIA